MRYALMERWNDCTHTFIFGFGEMTLTPVDYTAITGLGFAPGYGRTREDDNERPNGDAH